MSQTESNRKSGCFRMTLRDQDLHLGLEVLLTPPFPMGMDYTMLPMGASHYSL